MKFPPISWIVAGIVLFVVGINLHGIIGLPFCAIGGGAIFLGFGRLGDHS